MYKTLIIDDEKPVRQVIEALGTWRELGIANPFTACDGKAGLMTMREIKPDIVFVDMKMPIMDGPHFLKAATTEFPNTKYIIISGHDEFCFTKIAIQHNVLDYLLKPVVEAELQEVLKKAVAYLNKERHIPPNTLVELAKPTVEEIVLEIKDYLEKNYAHEIKLDMFSKKYFFTKEYLSKLFKEKYQLGIYEYALNLRMLRAKELLQDTHIQIQEISERLSYSNNNYFSKAFRNYFGISPTDYRLSLESNNGASGRH